MKRDTYRVVPFPRSRHAIVDALAVAHGKNVVHGLVEVDVTLPRRIIRDHATRTGEPLSFTGFVIGCLAQAVDEDKALQAYRAGRNRLVVFDDVDVATFIEREVRGQRINTPYIVRAANTKSPHEIHREIRRAQAEDVRAFRLMAWYGRLPGVIGRLFWRIFTRNPHWRKRMGGTASVTAVGMFGQGAGWGIPITNYTLQLTLGGIGQKPGVVDGRVEVREYLSLTISVDHDVVNGAPAARFAQRLKELIEGGHGLGAILEGAEEGRQKN